MNKTIADSVFNIRAALNMTQIELAKRLNVEQSTVHRWEAERTIPSVVMYLRVVKLLPRPVMWDELEHVIDRV